MLEFRGVTKAFGSVQALSDVSFTVPPGEIFGFVGANGAGKTTTMRIALGVLAADGGEVTWQGRALGPAERRQIGYMPEERGLYPKMRVGDQLGYLAQLHGLSLKAAQEAVKTWTERLGISERSDDEVQKLSLGNQQRVQLAAALVHNPAVLILDEPFSGLDPVAVEVMSGVLRGAASRGVPVIFSSHQLDLVERLCDRVGIIRGGRMVAVDTVANLQRSGPARWRIWAPQAPPGWRPGVPGISELAQNSDGSITVGLNPAAAAVPGADQQLLAAALQTGPVAAFHPVHAPLTELFRHVVESPAENEGLRPQNPEEAA